MSENASIIQILAEDGCTVLTQVATEVLDEFNALVMLLLPEFEVSILTSRDDEVSPKMIVEPPLYKPHTLLRRHE